MYRAVLASLVLSAAVAATVSMPAHAANARHPYSNIDRRNDAGNDTGNAETERLNSLQLRGGQAPGYPAQPYPAQPYPGAPYPGYWGPPPSAYYAPPGLYPQPGYGPGYPQSPGYLPSPYPPAYYPPRY